MYHHSAILLFILSTFLLTESYGQASQADINTIVTLHNNLRRSVNVGPLKWDNSIAAYGQSRANHLAQKCKLEHDGPDKRYGENLSMGGGTSYGTAGLVELWINEGYKGSFNHYSQMVWGESTSVGCGIARSRCGTYLACNYYPHGNVAGRSPYVSKGYVPPPQPNYPRPAKPEQKNLPAPKPAPSSTYSPSTSASPTSYPTATVPAYNEPSTTAAYGTTPTPQPGSYYGVPMEGLNQTDGNASGKVDSPAESGNLEANAALQSSAFTAHMTSTSIFAFVGVFVSMMMM
ncbi:CAP domain-containing protein [Paraphysoderma sedebokerense]|nr:CAP domain-containing protein [Paraphysoderma sedebokerense]